MSVYVDDMKAPYGRMVMCHMVGDTEDELLAMADKIGVARKWHQHPGTPRSHFDICKSKREAAIKAGALSVSQRDIARIIRERKPPAGREVVDG